MEWGRICSFIADSHPGLVRNDCSYALCPHYVLYEKGMAASLSIYLVPFIIVNACVHTLNSYIHSFHKSKFAGILKRGRGVASHSIAF